MEICNVEVQTHPLKNKVATCGSFCNTNNKTIASLSVLLLHDFHFSTKKSHLRTGSSQFQQNFMFLFFIAKILEQIASFLLCLYVIVSPSSISGVSGGVCFLSDHAELSQRRHSQITTLKKQRLVVLVTTAAALHYSIDTN